MDFNYYKKLNCFQSIYVYVIKYRMEAKLDLNTDINMMSSGLKLTEGKKNTIYDDFWENQNCKNKKPSQIERYIKHNSPDSILKFINIGGGSKMGTTLEDFAKGKFSSLEKRDKGKNTGYDHKIIIETKEIYVEQKSSGHWGENDYKWQHVEEKHKWHILLLCGIDYDEIYFWVMNRQVFQKLIEEKKIINQGNSNGDSSEGKWFNYSDVKDYLIQISTNEELIQYVKTV